MILFVCLLKIIQFGVTKDRHLNTVNPFRGRILYFFVKTDLDDFTVRLPSLPGKPRSAVIIPFFCAL